MKFPNLITLTTDFGLQDAYVGQIKGAGNIQFDGKLNGDLSCSGDVAIGEKATIQGNLSVNAISVSGQVNGNITAKDRIALKSTARVTGDIKAKRLSVEDGVTFIGKSEVNPSGGGHARPAEVEAKPAGAEADSEAGKGRGGLGRK